MFRVSHFLITPVCHFHGQGAINNNHSTLSSVLKWHHQPPFNTQNLSSSWTTDIPSYTGHQGSFSFSRPAECCHSLIRLVRTSTPANGNLRAGAQEHPLSADEGHHAFSSQPIAARLLMGRKKSRSALKMMFAPGILLAFYCQLSLGSCLYGTRLS